MQRLLQFGDSAAVNLNRSWMQFHDIAGIRDRCQIGGKAPLLCLHLDQARLHACRCDTVGNRVDDIRDLPFEIGKPRANLLPIMSHLRVQALPFGMILSEKFGNCIGSE
ncbi:MULTISPECIES: hypothetical protein [Hyphomicrobiales]|uniref:hypothetical protein n=1 Tax=Hyphomicrobiales TaxID=356 RepID=UPI001EF02DAB|nr:hypothetical protein [Rhodoligotrophos defluvii]